MTSARQYNPEIELKDIVQASALSFALGGLLGARRGHLHTTPVNPDAVKRAAGIGGEGTLSAMRDPNAIPLHNKTPGVAPLREEPDWLQDFTGRAEDNWQVMPHFARVRADLAARMGKAKSHVVREAGRLLFRDGVGYTDRSIAVKESTSEFAKRHLAVLETQWRRGVDDARDTHFKANNIRWWDVTARKRFNEEVGRAVRGERDVSPEALQAAKPIRESLRDAAKLAEESGLDGFTIESPRTRANLKETAEAIQKEANNHTLQQYQARLKEAEEQLPLKVRAAEQAEANAAKFKQLAEEAGGKDTLVTRAAREERLKDRYKKAEVAHIQAFKRYNAAAAAEEAREAAALHAMSQKRRRAVKTDERVVSLKDREADARRAFIDASHRLQAASQALETSDTKTARAEHRKATKAYDKTRQRWRDLAGELETLRPVPKKLRSANDARSAEQAFTRKRKQETLTDTLNRVFALMDDTEAKRAQYQQARESHRLARKANDLWEGARNARQAADEALQRHNEDRVAHAEFVASSAKPKSPEVASFNPDNYLPRYWNAAGFQRLFGELRLNETVVIQGLLRPALRKAWEASGRGLEVDDELLDAVGKAWLKRAQKHFEGDGMDLLIRPLGSDSVGEIGRLLDEAGVSRTQVNTLLGKLQRKADENGKLDRAKHRIDLDENFTTTLRNLRGEDVTVSVSDLLENDVDVVMNRYLREITGWSALSSKAGIKTRAQLDTFVETVKKDAFHAGDTPEKVARLLDIGLNATFGKSTEVNPSSPAARYGRFVRNWNFSRVMNQVGFTMFAELGPVIAHSGLRNVIRSIPEIPSMLKRGREGTLASKDAQVMEQLFAPGTDLIRNPPFLRLDEDGAMYQTTFDFKGAHHLDNTVNAANHITSIYSGMAPITAILQRVAGRGTLLRMMEMAKAKTLKQGDIDRLRTWGLDEAGQKQVFDYLKTVRKIEDIDPHALSLEARETLSAFMYRATRHQVLEGDASDSIGLMHGTTGRLVLQFRTFMFNSYTRHFLNSLHHINDWRTYQMLALSTAFAGMGWSARVYLNTIGDEKQRERLLTPENFIKNGIAQSSWAHFIPAVVDTVWGDFMRNEPVFQGNRSTGLQNSMAGIPTVDLAFKAWSIPGIATSLLSADERVTEQQMQDFWRIWWFSNMTGVRNIADAVLDGLPDRPDGTNR